MIFLQALEAIQGVEELRKLADEQENLSIKILMYIMLAMAAIAFVVIGRYEYKLGKKDELIEKKSEQVLILAKELSDNSASIILVVKQSIAEEKEMNRKLDSIGKQIEAIKR